MGTKKGIGKEMQHWETLRKGGKSSDAGLQQIWDGADRIGKQFQPDVEQGLRRLKRNMATQKSGKVVSMQSRRIWLQIAAAIAVLLVGWAVWSGDSNPALSGDWMAVTTGPNERREVVLPDGSAVTLNTNSEIRYASNLNESATRFVKLSGEAFFDVSHRPEQPFIIQSDFVEVQVLGTSFNVLARPEANYAEVEVSTGKVAVSHQYTDEKIVLLPNERARIEAQTPISKVAAPHLNSRSWESNKLKFRNTRLSTALPAIEKHFNIDFEVEDAGMLSCQFTASWEAAELSEILNALSTFTGQKVREIGPKNYLLSGSCK